MDVTPLIPVGRQIIKGYGDLGFTIAGVRWEGSVLVFSDRTVPWSPISLAEVTEEALDAVLKARPELLLLGCGPIMTPVPASIRIALRSGGIKLEVMDTGAACRTYNVLLAEERSVAAALIAV
ncbi:MAG: Mth938-like domain-containing protein [Phaeospirillum sp.]|nr:Mth938-like domain-containing protein [Phaeospirillum sp.]